MAFPQSVLPVRVRIAPAGRPAADPSTWVWVDITHDVRVASGITIEQGRADEGTNVDPGKCTLTLDNRSGNYSTRNVNGQWAGKLKKNTPLRVGTIAIADTFTRTSSSGWGTADTGQSWAHTNPVTDWTVNGSTALVSWPAANVVRSAILPGAPLADSDAQFTTSVPAVMTGAGLVVAMYARYINASNFYSLSCEFTPGGAITAKIRRCVGGTTIELAAASPVPGLSYVANQKMRTRAQADGPALRVKVWPDGSPEPDAWTLTASDTTFPDAGLTGFFLWLIVGNTNTKPFNLAVDDIEVEDVEFTGTVPEWPTRWDKSQKDVTAPIVATGILRRLQQGKSPLRSAITRRTSRYNPVADWPLEDASGATSAAATSLTVAPASGFAVEFGAVSTLPGASAVVGITASSVLAGRVPAHTATGTWAVVWYAYVIAPPAAVTRIMSIGSTGTARTWAVDYDSTALWLRSYDSAGTLIAENGVLYPPEIKPPAWAAFCLTVSVSAGTVTGTLLHFGVGDPSPTFYFAQVTFAGSPGSPSSWRAEGSLGYNEGAISHVSVYNGDPGFLTYDFANAANAYIGEAAAARIRRLCTEEGVPVIVEAGTSEPLGPQRSDTFSNLLYSAQDADLGILYERGAGLAYRPRGARYNRTVDLNLDFALGHVSEPPEPTDDDQRLRNQVTVTRDNGSSATVLDQASIDESGLYDDSKTINVQTDWVLPHHASARVKLGTVDEYRWPKIDINLARNPSLIPNWRAARAFPRMAIANEPSQVRGNAVDVFVDGYTQTLGPYGWDISTNCSPASPWTVAVAEDDILGRVDTDGANLRAEPSPAATSLLVDVVAGPRITTDPTQMPILVSAATGEDMRITSVAGTSNPQTLTVVRGLNGVNLPIPAGTPVNLTVPMRAAL
jgi:hypothetical protein